MKIGDKVYTKKLMWCEIGGTALFDKHGSYKGYSGHATKARIEFCNDELACWHCKKTISYGDDYAANTYEYFCLECVTETEPEPKFQSEIRELGYD